MKIKLTLAAIVASLSLMSCTSTGTDSNATTSFGKSIFKSAVDNKCRSELEQQRLWKIASLAMSETTKSETQTRICSCVSEQAAQDVTYTEMAKATIDTRFRDELTSRIVINSLKSCYSSIIR